MNKEPLMIVAHSSQQYQKCQDYLKGTIPIGDMYPLLITYYSEIMHLYNFRNENINTTSDEEVAKTFCLHLTNPE
jgi:hypothetical protein